MLQKCTDLALLYNWVHVGQRKLSQSGANTIYRTDVALRGRQLVTIQSGVVSYLAHHLAARFALLLLLWHRAKRLTSVG